LYLGARRLRVARTAKFSVSDAESGRTIAAKFAEEKLIQVATNSSPITKVFGRHDPAGGKAHFAALTADGNIFTGSFEEGGETVVEPVGGVVSGGMAHLAIDSDGRKLFAATDDGRLLHWQLEDSREKPYRVVTVGAGGRAITAMDFAIGNNALLLGFSDGSVEEWFGVRENPVTCSARYRKSARSRRWRPR
jgi:ABC-type uncharacterized transport system permease subunit